LLCQWTDEAGEMSTPQRGKHLSLPHLVVFSVTGTKQPEETINAVEDEESTMGRGCS